MITILIPTTRRSRLLERTLDSLARCRFPREVRELVVVENGPRGEAEKLLHSEEFPVPVRFLHLDRANKSHALNRVIETLPSGEWILFLDDDIRLEEEVIEAYAEAVREAQERNATPKLYFGGPVGVDRESEPPGWMEPLLPLSARGTDLKNSRPVLGYLGCNWMAQAEAIRELGGFNESLGPGAPGGASGQESEMMYRFEEAGYRPVDVPEAFVWHYVPTERVSESWLDRRFENYGASLARSGRGSGTVRTRWEMAKYTVRRALYALLGNRTEMKRSELELITRRSYLLERSSQSHKSRDDLKHEFGSEESTEPMHSPVRKDDLPDVSIIIPAWNSEKTLPDVLRGIERQDYPQEKIEIIVVDNGSADATQSLATKTGATLLVNDESKNPYLSRNMGAEKATGEILVFLDVTCAPEKGWLRAGVEALTRTDGANDTENRPADLAAGPVRFGMGPNPGLGEWLDSITFVDTERYVMRDQSAPGGNLFVRRDLWETLGPFPTGQRSGADMAWTQRATRNGYRLAYVPEATVRYSARPWRGYLAKYHRIGKGVGLQWRTEGRSPASVGWEILKTGGPPSPEDLRERIKRRGNGAMNRRFWALWSLEWMGRWALATGRARGYVKRAIPSAREEQRTKENRPILAFLYYTYYPIRGGASLHGAKLAQGLHSRGHRLVKLNGEPDPWSERWPTTPWHALKLLFKAEKIYARADFFLNGRNLLIALALLSGKKVIVELNCPSDELRMRGVGERRIRWTDRVAGFLLRRACPVVVVSESVGRYARQALHLTNTRVVENGGEGVTGITKTQPVLHDGQFRSFMQKHRTLALWTGTPTGLQSIAWVRELARGCPELGIVMAVNEEPGTEVVVAEEENVCILRNRSRDEVRDLVHRAKIGLAFYEPMPWSRWGFYLSPLKIPEFLNSGLHVITNAPGSPAQRACPGYHEITSPEEAARVAKKLMDNPLEPNGRSTWPPVRTWGDVANEVDQILKSC